MKRYMLFQSAAFACVLGGLLLIAGWTLDIGRDSLVGAMVVLAGYAFAALGFVGLYVVQADRVGWPGLLGFAFVLMAIVLFTPFAFLDVARISGVAPGVDRGVVESIGPTFAIGAIAGVGFMLGFILFGIATFRARVLARTPAVILTIAGVMPLVSPWLGVGKLLVRVGGVALVWLGASLWCAARTGERE